MKKTLIKLAMIFCVIGILSACNFSGTDEKEAVTPKEGNDNQKPEQVLNVVAEDNISSLDPAMSHDTISNTAVFNTMESLYSIGKDNDPVLTGASLHEISEDGLVHTFTIRDSKWSNGEPVTAFDYEYALKRAFDVTSFHLHIYKTAKILNADAIIEGEMSAEELGVRALDEKTLVLTLSGPNPLFVNHLTSTAFIPINQAFVEAAGDKFGTESNQAIYNGAFILTEWKHDQGWTYKKNSDYWDAENVSMEQVKVKVVKEESTAVNLFESDAVDLITITAAHVDKYKDDPGYSSQATSGVKFIRFNHNHEALANKNIRRALDMAWDKEALVDVILKNGSKAAYYLVPDTSKKLSGESFRSLAKDYSGTTEEAQQYWEKGLEEIGKDSIEVSILSADETDSRATAEYLQNQWETNLEGITVKIAVQPSQQRLVLEKAIDYDISLSSAGTLTTDPSNYLRMFITGDNFNRMDYSNPTYDELMTNASAELDEGKRFEMMIEAERILLEEDAAFGPMYQNATALVRKAYVKDVIHHPTIPQFSYRWASIEGK